MVLSALPAACSATTTTPTTPSRRRSSSWPAARRPSAIATAWPHGWAAWPGGSPCGPGTRRRGAPPSSGGSAVDDAKAAPAAVDLVGLEAASLVRAEVDRLPEADRLLLQLTYWQGKTYEEAAALLSWPIGTVRSRLSRVRERLRGRLARLGLAPVLAVAGSAAPVEEASAAQPPEALILRTVRAATRSRAG